MGEKITNSFEGGMKKDLDKKLRANNTYSLAVNGRLIFNSNGSLSWENAKGNIIGISGYPEGNGNRLLGKSEFPDFVILFSLVQKPDNSYVSEIGFVVFNPDGEGAYSRLYNDDLDVNGLKLNFDFDHQIEAVPFIESEELYRVYFTDDYNQPRVFSFKSIGTTFYQAISDSAFTMDILPDFNMGNITYVGTVSGGLITGQYQYSYRLLTKDGYASPWTPITYNIFVNEENVTENMQSYDMGDTDVPSNKGLKLKITDIDTRYTDIQVAYVHSIVSAGAKEAGIFADTDITGSTMEFEHISVRGVVPIEIDELSDVKDFIVKAKTIAIKDNRLWFGNVEGRVINDIPDEVFENFYAEPEYRAMMSDTNADRAVTKANSSPNGGFAATNHPPQSLKYKKRKYQRFDIADDYAISEHPFGSVSNTLEDYTNYKGRQTCHSFTGYFRGEKYRFAGVFFDKKGFPFFAKHLADITFPDVSGTNSSDTELKAQRVRTDGSIQTKTISTSLFGASVTTGRIGREQLNDISPTFNFDLNNKLADQRSKGTTYANNIINQYHLSHNAPLEVTTSGASYKPVGDYHKKTPTLWGNPNNIESDTVNSSENYLLQSMLRVQGVRFGGIDLNVDIGNGQKLKDVIGGFMIVRAERTELDESIKDSGILLNCTLNENSKDLLRPRNNPFLGTASTNGGTFMRESQGVRVLDDSNEGSPALVQPNVYTFDGVNHKVEAITPNIRAGNTKVKYLYDCLSSVFPILSGSTTSGNGISAIKTENQFLKHHWVAKFEDTITRRKLNTDSPQNGNNWFRRWYEYNTTRIIEAFKDIGMSNDTNSGIGTTAIKYTSQTLWGSSASDAREALNMWSDYSAENNTGDDSRAALLGVADRHLLFRVASMPFLSGFNDIFNPSDQNWGEFNACAAPVVALYEDNEGAYGGTNKLAIQSTIFHTTGHFQPINNSVLSQIDNGGDFVLNEVEVWGGDCYLDFFEYLRIYPLIEYEDDCVPQNEGVNVESERGGREYRDYSSAVIYPVQSKYNFKLRVSDPSQGKPIWSDVGTTNGATLSDDTQKNYNYPESIDGLFASNSATCNQVEEDFDVNDVLQYFDRVRSYQAKPNNYIDNVDYPTRWSWSNEKQPFNARIDKFRQFEELSNFDLDGAYGEVTGNALLFDDIYSLQEKAFGRLQVFDRALVATESIGDLTLGEGGVMDGIDYISKTYGSQHQWSIKASDKNIYWADARMRKLIRFGQEGLRLLSDEMGIHSYIAPYLEGAVGKDNPATVGGIVTAYDYEHNDVLFTFRLSNNNIRFGNPWYIEGSSAFDTETMDVDFEETNDDGIVLRQVSNLPSFTGINANLTIAFNENINAFTGIYTFYPTLYFNYGKHLYSNNNTKSGGLYIYNKGNRGEFMDAYYYSAIQFVVNKYPNAVKRFDTQMLNINEPAVDIIERVKMETENNFHTIPNLATETVNFVGYGANERRAKWRQGLLKFPTRERGKRSRLTGKQAEFKFYFKNRDNIKTSLTSVDTLIRVHNRI